MIFIVKYLSPLKKKEEKKTGVFALSIIVMKLFLWTIHFNKAEALQKILPRYSIY